MFDQSSLKMIEELVTVTKELEVLKEREKKLNKEVLQAFSNEGVNHYSFHGTNVGITTSERMTFKKGMKEQFVADMNASGRGHLVSIKVDVNKDSLKTDMATGTMSDAEIKKYVSITETKKIEVI